MKLIYLGHHPAVTSSAFDGAAERHGEPVDVPDRNVAEDLIARGDFLLFKPEPARTPVQTVKEK